MHDNKRVRFSVEATYDSQLVSTKKILEFPKLPKALFTSYIKLHKIYPWVLLFLQ